MRVLAIQNCEVEDFGLYEAYLREKGIDHTILRAFEGGEFPDAGDFDGFMVGGTPISVRDIGRHGFLERERDFLRTVVWDDSPCLGICFGAQLLARLLGAEVRKAPVVEIGGYDVGLTEEGKRSGLLKGFPDRFPVFQWHGDAFDVPRGARLLVRGVECPDQAFSMGNAAGVQFHLEVTAEEASRWADAYAVELAAAGRTKDEVVRECREREGAMRALAYRLMANFLDTVPRQGRR